MKPVEHLPGESHHLTFCNKLQSVEESHQRLNYLISNFQFKHILTGDKIK